MYYLIHKGHFIKGDSILKGQREKKKRISIASFCHLLQVGIVGDKKKGKTINLV
jgi:hypothetical protein